ncbi:hypothetical protein SBDP1_950020 [Syntrophobacter sp. SbD1]|nr:hypothetical protein SBDP1_950020 [Syntrophobacter sp. SbD1]
MRSNRHRLHSLMPLFDEEWHRPDQANPDISRSAFQEISFG